MKKGNSTLRKVNRNFQVTLPADFRKRFNIHEGDLLEVVEGEEEVVIRPVEIEIKRKQVLEHIKESFAEIDKNNPYSNMSEEEVMKMVNKAREDYREEKKTRDQ
ncbi:MAG: AbrB/MazE/SpoVT family DNA-binding domain-containing protein [Nitrospirae bacterium]|nr:AbrB/MazE/SpoVT family DNA-binding domain-containing protein [Nitrospirota bacterium]